MRQAIWRKADAHWRVFGIPDVLYVDNGADFVSKHMEQVAIDLKIRLVFSTPGKPQGPRQDRPLLPNRERDVPLRSGRIHTRRGHRKPTLTLEQLGRAESGFFGDGRISRFVEFVTRP